MLEIYYCLSFNSSSSIVASSQRLIVFSSFLSKDACNSKISPSTSPLAMRNSMEAISCSMVAYRGLVALRS